MKNLSTFQQFRKTINEAQAGLMHKLLKVPKEEKISSKYTSGKKLATDLYQSIKKTNIVPAKDARSKAASMLAFAANWPSDGKNSVLDRALKSLKSLKTRQK